MKRAGFGIVALGLVACAPVQQKLVYPPVVEVERISLTSLRLPTPGRTAEAGVQLELRIENPNPLPVRLARIEGALVVEGQEVGQVTMSGFELPAQGETRQVAQLDLPLTLNTAAVFLGIARGQEVSYRLDGTLTADFGSLGQPKFGPFTLSQGVWKQAPLRLF